MMVATAMRGLYFQNVKGQYFLVLHNGALKGDRKRRVNEALHDMCEEYYPALKDNPDNDRAKDLTKVCTRLDNVTISQSEDGATMDYSAHHCGGYGIPSANFKYRVV